MAICIFVVNYSFWIDHHCYSQACFESVAVNTRAYIQYRNFHQVRAWNEYLSKHTMKIPNSNSRYLYNTTMLLTYRKYHGKADGENWNHHFGNFVIENQNKRLLYIEKEINALRNVPSFEQCWVSPLLSKLLLAHFFFSQCSRNEFMKCSVKY